MRAETKLARFLGWFSLGLGVPQVLMPGRVARAIGVRDDRDARFWMRLVGLREHAAAAGILGRRRPVGWLSARAAGDVMDLALLAVALTRKEPDRPLWRLARGRADEDRPDRRRIGIAMGAVGGVLAVDALAAVSLTRRSRGEPVEAPPHVKAAITVARDPELVRRSWLDLHAGDGMGAVRFVPAPAGRGTEIHVDMEPDVPGDGVGATAAKLFGAAPEQRVKDELRRFKQLLEAGEVVRSDASPEGADAGRQLKQRPAHPLAEQPTRPSEWRSS
jgi:hypothetical protein